jgi:hypothetical protein
MDELATGAASAPTNNASTSQAVDQSGDQQAVLFDDLTSDQRPTNKTEKKAELPAETVEGLKTDGKKESTSKKEPKESKESKEPKEADGKKEEQAKLEAKKIKAKMLDKEYELEDEAVVTVKVDGKDVEVPIKDLLSNYSGKTAWDKRFSELDKERKMYLKTKDETEGRIKEIFNEQDPEMRFYKMAQLAGSNPLEVRRKFLEENLNLLEKWYSMSDDERKADELAYENRYLKHQQETMHRQTAQQKARAEIENKVSSLMATHNLKQDQFVSRYEEIESLVKQGKLEADKLTPDFIAESIAKDNLWDAAAQTVSELKIDGVSEDKIFKLVELSYQEGLKATDIVDVVKELWGGGKARKIIADKEKQRSEFYEGRSEPKREVKTGDDDVWSFEQI